MSSNTIMLPAHQKLIIPKTPLIKYSKKEWCSRCCWLVWIVL